MFEINDLVVLKNDINKIVFYIIDITNEDAILSGHIYRVSVQTKIENLEIAPYELVENETKKINKQYTKTINHKQRNPQKVIFGTILHIDSDKKFLESCLKLYKEMKVHAWGLLLKEKDISKVIENVVNEVTPDIIVLTGHDYHNGKDIKDLNNYENTNKYIDAIRIIRSKFNTDSTTVIAGACCSHFEALIASGANFASSPKRIHIHTYDPAIIAIKCATTSCNQVIDFNSTLKFIENGKDAFGGIETKGKMKILL